MSTTTEDPGPKARSAVATPRDGAAEPTTSGRQRSLAPDVARGFMLLLIALAHAPAFVAKWDVGWLDRAGEFVRALVAENQARSMFIFLFGYGLGQMLASRQISGDDWPSVRGVLRRRGVVFVVIGLLHTALLVPVDIIGVYGFALLMLTPLVRASGPTLLWTAFGTIFPAITLIGWQTQRALVAQGVGSPETMIPYMSSDYVHHTVSQLPTWLPETAISVVIVAPGMLLGIWASRRRYLDDPAAHVRSLTVAVTALLSFAVVGRLPEALAFSGSWHPTFANAEWTLAIVHSLAGYAGGIGLAGAVALAVRRLNNRGGPIATAIAALGQRSLTFYLAQSAVWLLLFYPFTLGLHDDTSFAGALGIAVVMWIVSVVLADVLRRIGVRGPFEWLTRRLSYRSRRQSESP